MSNDVRITLCNLSGQATTELDGYLDDVTIRLNGVGIANLSILYSAPKMHLGQRIAVELANGLPMFAGVIDYPLRRRADAIGIRVNSGEHLLSFRRTPVNYEVSGTRGAIMSTALNAANSIHPTGLVLGGAASYGESLSRTYNREMLLDIANELADTQDYAVIPRFEGSQLIMEFHWYQQRGRDRRELVLLTPDTNSIRADVQGPIRNHIIAVGDGITADATDAASTLDHGRREHVIYFSDVDDESALQDLADQYLSKWSRGGHRLTLSAIAPSEAYDVGDIVSLEAFMDKGAWALDIPVRIIARSWAPDAACTLEVEEWV